MKKIISLCFLSVLFLNICGCVPLIIGGALGALGGYAVSKDTVQGDTDIPYEALWDSAVRVAGIRGTVAQEDTLKGYLELGADSSRVWIRLIRLTRVTTRVRISARKHHLPNLNLAEELYIKIMEGAK